AADGFTGTESGTASGCAANEVLNARHRAKMDKRIGWNFDSTQHATFNPVRPMRVRHPHSVGILSRTYLKTHSQLSRSHARFLDGRRIIDSPTINMRMFKRRVVLRAGVVALMLIFLWAMAVGPEPPARITISPDELVRAVTIQRESLIDLCLMERVDPNGRDPQRRTPLLIAASQEDWNTARRILDAGAMVDLADKTGFTPVLAAAMHGNLEMSGSRPARANSVNPD